MVHKGLRSLFSLSYTSSPIALERFCRHRMWAERSDTESDEPCELNAKSHYRAHVKPVLTKNTRQSDRCLLLPFPANAEVPLYLNKHNVYVKQFKPSKSDECLLRMNHAPFPMQE